MRYVISDLHGNKKVFDKIVSYLEQNDPDYVCYCLGDVADRGKDGYNMIKQILHNNHFIYLKGNHEQMFCLAARLYKKHQSALISAKDALSLAISNEIDIQIYYQNGGEPTLTKWIEEESSMSVITALESLPIKASYYNYDMCHSGCLQSEWDSEDENLFMWTRKPGFVQSWIENRILVHGHTPIHCMPEFNYYSYMPPAAAYRYNKNKINIDYGTAFTNIAILYNLDSGVSIAIEGE